MSDSLTNLTSTYYAAPIPRSAHALTVMGIVFDKVYFPGVYMPKSGFDQGDLDREIQRIGELRMEHRPNDILLPMLKFVEHARTLEGFCEFTATRKTALEQAVSGEMVDDLYQAIQGPHPPGWTPTFDSVCLKSMPGSEEAIVYPGVYHYMTGALLFSSKSGSPLLNDMGGLPIPSLNSSIDNASLLASIIALECTKLVLPTLQALSPAQLMEFRELSKPELRMFRRSMLTYAGELNTKLADSPVEEVSAKTKFFVETEILPALEELREAMNRSNRSWAQRFGEGVRFIADLGMGFMSMNREAAITAALAKHLPAFLASEAIAAGDAKAARKRSGLYYLLRLENAVS